MKKISKEQEQEEKQEGERELNENSVYRRI